jgi:hypothetical protein
MEMGPSKLGSFNMKEAVVSTTDGMRACQDFGKAFVKELP